MTVMVVTAQILTQDAVELLNVVMDTAMVMKLKHHVQKTVHQVVHVMTVNLILHHMALNAVIQHGMNMVLIVPHWKAAITGIVLDVHALVTVTLSVVTDLVMVMRPMTHAQKTVMSLAHVIRVKL